MPGHNGQREHYAGAGPPQLANCGHQVESETNGAGTRLPGDQLWRPAHTSSLQRYRHAALSAANQLLCARFPASTDVSLGEFKSTEV